MKDLKYVLAYTIPISTYFSIIESGYYTFLTVFYAYGFIPILEIILDQQDQKYDSIEKENRLKNKLFDLMLYFNIPIVLSLLGFGLWQLSNTSLTSIEQTGKVLSLGILLATNGINVAHELGHRVTSWERYGSKLLLCLSLYMHFYIEHNFGHHKNVATSEDPATAKKNQSLYEFWWTSILGQIKSAWHLQKILLKQRNVSFFSIYNDLLFYFVFQVTYLLFLYLTLGRLGMFYGLLIAFVSVLMLESINYIEHYGLLRKKGDSGRYEPVKTIHSWNSNHIVGRLVLYELTRHSDHHHRASKKYQVLENSSESPQLPWGYPTSMLVALIPPLWFYKIHPRLEAFEGSTN